MNGTDRVWIFVAQVAFAAQLFSSLSCASKFASFPKFGCLALAKTERISDGQFELTIPMPPADVLKDLKKNLPNDYVDYAIGDGFENGKRALRYESQSFANGLWKVEVLDFSRTDETDTKAYVTRVGSD